MTVGYDSYEALVIQYAMAQLAAGATFQSIVLDPLLPNQSIIESLGGVPTATQEENEAASIAGTTIDLLTEVYAIVHADSFEQFEIAHNTYGYRAAIRITLAIPPVTADTPPEILRRVRNYAGLIRADISALFGQAGYLLRGTISIDETSVMPEDSMQKGYGVAVLTIHFSSP